jgi:hypothetical protein
MRIIKAFYFIIATVLLVLHSVEAEEDDCEKAIQFLDKVKTFGKGNDCAMYGKAIVCMLPGLISYEDYVKACKICVQSPPGELGPEDPITDPHCCCALPWFLANFNSVGECLQIAKEALQDDPYFCTPAPSEP